MKPKAFSDGRQTTPGGTKDSKVASNGSPSSGRGWIRTAKKSVSTAWFFSIPILLPAGASLFLLFVLAMAGAGCGVHYYNPRTGVEHVWGFGHLQMRVQPPTNGVEAVVKGYDIWGLKVGGSAEDYGCSLGYDSRRMILISPRDAQFSLQWPDASFFNVRIGTNFPGLLPVSFNPSDQTNGIIAP